MPRKTKGVLPPAAPATAPPTPELRIEPTQPQPEPRKKVGRPTKEEVAARQEAARQAALMKPDDVKPLTAIVLASLCKMARGEPPLEPEIELTNVSMTAVFNKYSVSNKYGPELALFACLVYVVQQSRQRRGVKQRAETGGSRHLRPEREREDATSAAVSTGTT